MITVIELINIALIIQLFVLINPLSSFPVLLAAYKNKLNIKRIAISAVILAFIVAIVIAIIGPYLFSLFKITIDSFRVAGGVILFLLGLDNIRGKKDDKGNVKESDALTSIIATPLLTGPATISFITIKSYEIGIVPILSNILITFILVGIVFILFSLSVSKINKKVIDITSRILGLFLTAVAIEMIATGIQGLMNIG
jgi:multiple antibiotic resistance protein